MAPSTPPPPSNERLAAFTMASTSSVVMSATTMSRTVWPISAESAVMRASLSRAGSSCCGLKVQAGAHTDIVVVGVQETAGGAAAIGAQHFEEIIVGAEAAGVIQRLRRPCKGDAMDVDPPVLPGTGAARQLALVDQLADERNTAQLRHQRRVERDLVDPRQDLVLRLRHLLALQWIDLNQQQVLCICCADQRVERWIADITAIPIRLTIDLDGAEKVRQACRGYDHVGGHFLAAEYVQLSGSHVGRRDKQLQVLGRPDRLEIDET